MIKSKLEGLVMRVGKAMRRLGVGYVSIGEHRIWLLPGFPRVLAEEIEISRYDILSGIELPHTEEAFRFREWRQSMGERYRLTPKLLVKPYAVHEIRDVMVEGKNFTVLTSNLVRLIVPPAHHLPRDVQRSLTVRRGGLYNIAHKPENRRFTTAFDFQADRNIYQWMIRGICRLYLLSLPEYSDVTLIAPEFKPDSYQADTLGVLRKALSPDRVEVVPDDTILSIPRLLLPSEMTSLDQVSLQPQCADFVRELFFQTLGDKVTQPRFSPYIYISRRSARRRPMRNEEELEGRLQELGFDCLRLEDLRLEDQVNSFAHAKLVVAPHGAGLTNILFCPPHTRIIEFLPSCRVRDTYYGLALSLGLDRYSFLCESDGAKHGAFSVDIEKTIAKVKQYMDCPPPFRQRDEQTFITPITSEQSATAGTCYRVTLPDQPRNRANFVFPSDPND